MVIKEPTYIMIEPIRLDLITISRIVRFYEILRQRQVRYMNNKQASIFIECDNAYRKVMDGAVHIRADSFSGTLCGRWWAKFMIGTSIRDQVTCPYCYYELYDKRTQDRIFKFCGIQKINTK